MSERRVVVTGLGVVNALGNDVKTFWNNLLNGVSGAKNLINISTPIKKGL